MAYTGQIRNVTNQEARTSRAAGAFSMPQGLNQRWRMR